MTPISYQLYSSRGFPPIEATLGMLSGLGYSEVEGWGGLYADPDQVAELERHLKASGLSMPSGHFGFEMVRNDADHVLAIARRLEMRAVFVPAPPSVDFQHGKGDWRAFAVALADAGRPYWDAGLHFGYHNHDWEFVPREGKVPLDILMEASEHMMLELDVAWSVRAHQSPLTWIQKYRDRLVAAHIKDIAPEGENQDEDGWADVGHGTMDWQGLFTALKSAGCEIFVVEHDNPGDDRRFAARAIEAIRSYE